MLPRRSRLAAQTDDRIILFVAYNLGNIVKAFPVA